MSEAWLEEEGFCTLCGGDLKKSQNNAPVFDLSCVICKSQYELKSQKGGLSKRVNDGAYTSMMQRIHEPQSPHFFFLGYDPQFCVSDLIAIPNYLITPSIIEKRKPLSSTARRAGWTGCNIMLDQIPSLGKIHFVKQGVCIPTDAVLKAWKNTTFIAGQPSVESRGWMLDVMVCIEQIKSERFSLQQVYGFEGELARKHPDNRFVKDKIRQQLQALRDKGYIEFMGNGQYQLAR